MVFQAIPSKFSCATFQKPSNTSHFVPLFLAHGDVVVRIAIFHIKLSTPRLGSFICSLLILHESWSDHCNLILKRKKALLQWNEKVGGHPMESVSHGLRKEKGGEKCQSFIKEHQCAKFSKNLEPLSLVYYGR